MDSITDQKIKKYSELVRQEIPVNMIILYGSYANGRERPDSDIDIAVVVDELDGDYLETSANLFSLCREVDTKIEPKLVVKKNNRSGFLDSILKNGKIIYQSG